jgi:hypothetical protein
MKRVRIIWLLMMIAGNQYKGIYHELKESDIGFRGVESCSIMCFVLLALITLWPNMLQRVHYTTTTTVYELYVIRVRKKGNYS